MRINPQDKIAHVPATDVRKFLRRTSGCEWDIESVTSILTITESGAKLLLKELVEAGFVAGVEEGRGEGRFRNTPKGQALALARAAKPIYRKTADKLLAGLLERVERVNEDRHLLYKVTEVRVFGSYLGDGPRLGDVDVAVGLAPKEEDPKVHWKRSEERVREAIENGRTFSTHIDELCWPKNEVFLFLKKRSRALSLHDIHDGVLTVTKSRVIFSEHQT